MPSVFEHSLFLLASALAFWLGFFIRVFFSGTRLGVDRKKRLSSFGRSLGRLIGLFGIFIFVYESLSMHSQGMFFELPFIWPTLILVGLSTLFFTVIFLFDNDLRGRWFTLTTCSAMFIFTWHLFIFFFVSVIKRLF
jgi:hypothetical protein